MTRFGVKTRQRAACATHHDGGELDESKTTVQLGLLVLDDPDIGGGENCVWCQGIQNGVHCAVRVQIPQDDSCQEERRLR